MGYLFKQTPLEAEATITRLEKQLAFIGGELAASAKEGERLRHTLGAWASVVECYIRAFDCNLPAEQIANLDELREMVAEVQDGS